MLQNAYLLAKIGADTAENERDFADRPSCRRPEEKGRNGRKRSVMPKREVSESGRGRLSAVSSAEEQAILAA